MSVVVVDLSRSACWGAGTDGGFWGPLPLPHWSEFSSVLMTLTVTHGLHFLNRQGSCFFPPLSSVLSFHTRFLISNLYRYGI